MKSLFSCLFLGAVSLLGGCGPASRGTLDEALTGFLAPQDTARTKVWWFHGETETTREGITADLEAYKRAGVGGVVYYDQVHGPGTGACEAFSDEWWEMLRWAAAEARRVGLGFEAHVSNGFVAGGPWITPELSMQRLVAVDTLVEGDTRFEGSLPLPQGAGYRDVAVLAVPVSERGMVSSDRLRPQVTGDLPGADAARVLEAGLVRIAARPRGERVKITLDFGRPVTVRGITYRVGSRGKATTSATNVPGPPSETFVGTGYRRLPDIGVLEVSSDGVHYAPVRNLEPIYTDHSSWRRKTLSFPAAEGRWFRLNLGDWYEEEEANPDLRLGEVTLWEQAMVDCWEEKAALISEYVEGDRTPRYAPHEAVPAAAVTDLTDRMDAQGVLRWDVPAGRWVVMRFGHLSTGGRTKHGRRNLMGLECDKMSAEAARVQWDNYFCAIADTLARHGLPLAGMAMDSHEAGSQNWTPGFEREFRRLRGYDPLPWLPVMNGWVVGSAELSDRFLYDVRRTVADLIAEKYYGTFDSLCRSRGMTFTAQATGNALCIVADPIQAKGRVAKPQGEFWAIHPDGNYDIKESSSAAHLYGKPVASAEAYTDARFSQSLAYLKSLGDYAYCFGINEFVVCASAAQPGTDGRIPGNTGGGRHYCLNRNNPLWEQSAPFWDWQARCSWLMRQGMPVVDLCVYLGENAPVKILTYRLPEIPAGVDFDAFTSDALFSRMSARKGRVALPDGMSYSMIALPRNGEVTLDALRRLAALVREGVPLWGARPRRSGAMRDAGREAEYAALVAEMWGPEPTEQGVRCYGRGLVCWGISLGEAMAAAGLEPDVRLAGGDTRTEKLYFAHRRLRDGDLWYFDNHKDAPLCDTFSLRTGRRSAELWNTVTGERYALPVEGVRDGRLLLRLEMAPRESFVVVTRDRVSDPLPQAVWSASERSVPVEGPWRVEFSREAGGPGEVLFAELEDWTRHDDPSVRYYSGTAVYRKTLRVEAPQPGERTSLRFGGVGASARLTINGRPGPTVWCSPWQADVTDWLVPGENELEIRVVNPLMNRMILDARLPESERVTFAVPQVAAPGEPLVPSGLWGGVELVYRMGRRP